MSSDETVIEPDAPAPGKDVAVRPAKPFSGGGGVVAIVPQNLDDMFRLAKAFHMSELAPKTLNSAEKVLVALLAGAELGFAPFQACQSFYVVNGRPTIWGDAIPALLWANRFKIREWFEGEGDTLIAKCEITRPDGDVIPGEFSMDDARDAKLLGKDGPWQTARKRMLKMRARAFTARDGAADVLKGFRIREEEEDITVVPEPAPAADLAGRLAQAGRGREGFNAEHPVIDDEAHVEEVLAEVSPIGGERGQVSAATRKRKPKAEPAPVVGETSTDEVVEGVFEPITATDAGTPATGFATTETDDPQADAAAQSAEPAKDTKASAMPASGASAAETSSQEQPAEVSPAGEKAAPEPQDEVETPRGGETAHEALEGMKAASEPPAGQETDPVDWAIRVNREIDEMKSIFGIDSLLADPHNKAMFAKLDGSNPAMAKALNAAIVAKRAKVK